MVLTAILIITALILINALYVGAEFGAVGVRRSRIRQLAADGNPFASWLLPVIESPAALDRYIAACQIGITLSSLILGAYAQATLAIWLTPAFTDLGQLQHATAQSVSSIVVLLVLTVFQVIVGELVPKSLALQYPTPAALYTTIPMAPSLWLFHVFIKVLNGSGLVLLRLVGAPQQAHRQVHSPEEIELLIAESRDGGLLEPDEHRRLHRALRLNLKQARQLMVPRRRISSIHIDTPLDDVISLVTRNPFSRLPVYRDSIDDIVGVVHTKDLVRTFVEDDGPRTLAPLIRPVVTVPETATVDRVLKILREQRSHQALVVDEFGGTEGLITLEDVLAELLGEVGDEFRPADEPLPEALGDGRYRLPGNMAVDDVAHLVGTEWETGEATVGGLITEALGHLPAWGERVAVGDVEFVIERTLDHAVESVIVRRIMAGTEDES
jgi:CBS domain containing-hemolysin-like protein